MEINQQTQTISSIYTQLAQKRAELDNVDKKDEDKSSYERYDKVDISNNKYDENDYQRVLDKYKSLDQNTKTHEQNHASGANTTSAIQYSYQTGPDGKLYANGGSVRFDTSIPQDKGSAAVKMEQLKDASTSVDGLSSADAQISRTANLNRLLLQSQGENNDN